VGEESWKTVLLLLGIISYMAGMLKYVSYMLDKNQKHIDNRFNDLEHAQTQNAKVAGELRQEVYQDFVRREDFAGLAKTIREDTRIMFKKIDGISKAVNQLVGKVNGSIDPS